MTVKIICFHTSVQLIQIGINYGPDMLDFLVQGDLEHLNVLTEER